MSKDAKRETRSSIFSDGDIGDLSDFGPKPEAGQGAAPATPKPLPEVVKQIGENAGFTSREPRRYRTGRDTQLNTRVRSSYKTRFYHLADVLEVPLGDAMERAIDLLDKQVYPPDNIEKED